MKEEIEERWKERKCDRRIGMGREGGMERERDAGTEGDFLKREEWIERRKNRSREGSMEGEKD